jgi:hypothetical protein
VADKYYPTSGFADISAFVADANAINAATKTALNTALTNIGGLMGLPGATEAGGSGTRAAHPDFNKVPPEIRDLIQNELAVLRAAVTAHA